MFLVIAVYFIVSVFVGVILAQLIKYGQGE